MIWELFKNQSSRLVFLVFIFIARKFLKTKNISNNSLVRLLSYEEKLAFVKTTVSWIEGKDIMDTCFVLNFGYEDPLPWPQVKFK